MKHIKKYIIMAMVSMFFGFISLSALAVIANPKPIQVSQPDGSTITIQKHGDEYLNWTTSAGKLIAQGADGFYYYASFNADGISIPSASRVKSSGASSFSFSKVQPPMSAVMKANQKRYLEQTKALEGRPFKNSANRNEISTGSKKFLTILVEFDDLEFIYKKSDFESLLNDEGYSVNGATGSVKDFYTDNAGDKFNPQYDVYGPYKAKKGYAKYGVADEGALELFKEAVELADDDVNFADYDLDSDGYVDNVFFYFAGHNEAEGGPSTTIWPHKWSMWKYDVRADGKKVFNYACTSELKGSYGDTMCGIGTFCHEFGHVLGLPDYYDTNYEQSGQAAGLGLYSLMSSGNYNNEGRTPPYLDAESRYILGWMDKPLELTKPGNYSLRSIKNNVAFTTPTKNEGEYFLYENRQSEGWDEYVPSGLLIYHVDKSNNRVGYTTAKDLWERWEESNKINANSSHQCFDLVESCGKEYNIDWGYENVAFPGADDVTSFTGTTSPAAVGWDKKATGYDLTEIKNGSEVTFKLTVDGKEADEGPLFQKGISYIKTNKNIYSDGDVFKLEIMPSKKEFKTVTWTFDGAQKSDKSEVVLDSGDHEVVATIKYKDGSSDILTYIVVVK